MNFGNFLNALGRKRQQTSMNGKGVTGGTRQRRSRGESVIGKQQSAIDKRRQRAKVTRKLKQVRRRRKQNLHSGN